MKKITTAFAIAALFCCLTSCHKVQYGGQTGKIMHKKYDPALNINYIVDDVEQTWDTLMIDVDGDQTTDLKICFLFETPYIIAAPDWELSVATNGYINIVTWWNKGYQVFWEHLSAICLRHTTDEGPSGQWHVHSSDRFGGRERNHAQCGETVREKRLKTRRASGQFQAPFFLKEQRAESKMTNRPCYDETINRTWWVLNNMILVLTTKSD